MKILQKVTIAFFGLWLLSGFAGVLIGVDEGKFSASEMRKPTTFKNLSKYDNAQQFLKDVENFFNDRVYFRGAYIALYQALGLESLSAAFKVNNSSVKGSDDWLFLGNSYSQVLDYTKNEGKLDTAAVAHRVKQFKHLQDLAAKYSIPFTVLIGPNKHTIYSEFLPEWFKPKSEYRFADAVLDLAQKEHVHVIYPKKEILAEKARATSQGTRIYYKDDTHWNHAGAFVAFKELWGELQKQGTLFDLPKAIRLEDSKKPFNGDLISIGKYDDSYKDELDYKYVLDSATDPNNLKKGHLLLLADSYSEALMPLYDMAFAKITRLHWTTITMPKYKELVETLRPDVIIFETVERDLSHAGMLLGEF